MMAQTTVHPVPTTRLPEGIDPDSAESVRRFVLGHSFPSSDNGRWLFAFMDEEDDFASIALRHGLAGHRNPPAFHRCAAPGIGVLHLVQVHAPTVARIEYRLECLGRGGTSAISIDPLNPHIVRNPFSSNSVVTASHYRPPEYVHDDVHARPQQLRESEFNGPIGKPWQTWIWNPPQRSDAERLPVVLFLDGGDWLTLNHADRILGNLVRTNAIAPCRAVFVKPAARNLEYSANPATAAYLSDELPRMLADCMPWPRESKRRIAVGCSLGALCLLHAHFTQPGVFGGLILQSGAFFQPQTDAMELGFEYFPQISRFVSSAIDNAAGSIPRIAIHMTCGNGEENLLNNHALAKALTRHGFPLTFHHQPDAHNWTCWRDCIGGGLMRLLPAR